MRSRRNNRTFNASRGWYLTVGIPPAAGRAGRKEAGARKAARANIVIEDV